MAAIEMKLGSSDQNSTNDDLEKQSQNSSEAGEEPQETHEEPTQDPNLITWSGPSDPENPKNWPIKTKWAATVIVSGFTLISPISSAMVAPALEKLSKDLHITNEITIQLTLSIFVLAYAIGPLFLGPLSEVFGRVRVLQLSMLFYFVWNLGCGFARNEAEMIAFRFLSGLGGSAPLAIGAGVLGDCWTPDQRGKAVGVYSLAPLLGPAIGPIAGGFIAEKTTWRWVFWATSIIAVCIQALGLFFLHETHAPTILKRRVARLRKKTGNEMLHTDSDKSLSEVIGPALIRPFRLLGTQPIVQLIAIYMGYLFGLLYLILSTFPTLWTTVYDETVGIGGLNYLSMGIGLAIGAQISARVSDRIYRRLKARNNGVGRPEFRLPLMFLGSVFLPIGLFWYGWSVEARTHWIVPNLGMVFVAVGFIFCMQSMQMYAIDSYTTYAASALAAVVVLRSLGGFGFPLFAPAMYHSLGYGWGNSVLGFVALFIGVPSPLIFWRFGVLLRGKSRFAAG